MTQGVHQIIVFVAVMTVMVLLSACGGNNDSDAAASSFGSISGTVLAASGSPQPSVHVRAILESNPLVQVGRFTDGDGGYRIDGLLPGSYQVVVENIDGRGTPAVTRNRISNGVTESTPQFPDEYYSAAAENATDDPALSTSTTVTANQLMDGINFTLNDSGTPGGVVLPGAESVAAIAIGDTVNGTLGEQGDFTDDVGLGVFVDYFSFTGAAGRRVTVSLDSTAFDAVLIVWGPNGFNPVDDDSGTGANALMTFALPEVGTYIIGVTSYAKDQKGAYTLSLQAAAPDNTPVIAFGATINGALATSDTVTSGFFEDTYRFDATAGTAYTLSLSSAAFDSFLILLSPTNLLTFNDDANPPSPDARLSGTLAETGTWYVIVSSLGQGETGSYQLTLTSP